MKASTTPLTSLHNFIDWYCNENGFGSMNKNDFEVFIFNEWFKTHNSLSDYAISRQLRIPESKVKRLKYEAAIVFSTAQDKNQLEDEFITDLQNAKYKNEDGKLRFLVHNKLVRQYINDILENDGRFLDSSLTSSTVSMSVEDFSYAMDQLRPEAVDKKQVMEAAKKMYNKADGFDKTFPEILKQVLLEQSKSIIGNYTTDAIVAAIDKITTKKGK